MQTVRMHDQQAAVGPGVVDLLHLAELDADRPVVRDETAALRGRAERARDVPDTRVPERLSRYRRDARRDRSPARATDRPVRVPDEGARLAEGLLLEQPAGLFGRL